MSGELGAELSLDWRAWFNPEHPPHPRYSVNPLLSECEVPVWLVEVEAHVNTRHWSLLLTVLFTGMCKCPQGALCTPPQLCLSSSPLGVLYPENSSCLYLLGCPAPSSEFGEPSLFIQEGPLYALQPINLSGSEWGHSLIHFPSPRDHRPSLTNVLLFTSLSGCIGSFWREGKSGP